MDEPHVVQGDVFKHVESYVVQRDVFKHVESYVVPDWTPRLDE